MPSAQQYEAEDGRNPFQKWFLQLEPKAAARVVRSVAKLEARLRPDTKAVGEGVFEARIDFGPGYRVYFGLDGAALVILLGGGDKRTQQQDIADAHAAWADYKRRKKGVPANATHPQLPGNSRRPRRK